MKPIVLILFAISLSEILPDAFARSMFRVALVAPTPSRGEPTLTQKVDLRATLNYFVDLEFRNFLVEQISSTAIIKHKDHIDLNYWPWNWAKIQTLEDYLSDLTVDEHGAISDEIKEVIHRIVLELVDEKYFQYSLFNRPEKYLYQERTGRLGQEKTLEQEPSYLEKHLKKAFDEAGLMKNTVFKKEAGNSFSLHLRHLIVEKIIKLKKKNMPTVKYSLEDLVEYRTPYDHERMIANIKNDLLTVLDDVLVNRLVDTHVLETLYDNIQTNEKDLIKLLEYHQLVFSDKELKHLLDTLSDWFK